MAVVMKGGTSGNRFDSLAPVPDSGQAQPVLRTETSASHTVQFCQNSGNSFDATPSMPTGGTHPEGSTDIQDQTA